MFDLGTKETRVNKSRLGSYTDYDTRATSFCVMTARSEVPESRACVNFARWSCSNAWAPAKALASKREERGLSRDHQE